MKKNKILRVGLQAGLAGLKGYDWYRKKMKKKVKLARKVSGMKVLSPVMQPAKAVVKKTAVKAAKAGSVKVRGVVAKVKPDAETNKKICILAGAGAFGAAALGVLGNAAGRELDSPRFRPGNQRKYKPEVIPQRNIAELDGKEVIFLGSSVTLGSASLEDAFPEYLSRMTGCKPVKECVSGTTLTDRDDTSYVERLRNNLSVNLKPVLLVCQLSTNDATRQCLPGKVTESKDIETFDTKTVCGAIEYIIAYAKKTWRCPVMFYTNPRYDSEDYQLLVNNLLIIQKKWGIGLIDFWNNEEVNRKLDENRSLYMADSIHPMRAGYREVLCPVMQKEILTYLKNS